MCYSSCYTRLRCSSLDCQFKTFAALMVWMMQCLVLQSCFPKVWNEFIIMMQGRYWKVQPQIGKQLPFKLLWVGTEKASLSKECNPSPLKVISAVYRWLVVLNMHNIIMREVLPELLVSKKWKESGFLPLLSSYHLSSSFIFTPQQRCQTYSPLWSYVGRTSKTPVSVSVHVSS